MVGVEQQEQGIANQPFPQFVDLVNGVAGQPYADTAHEARVPALVGHLLARGIEPRNIFDLGAADGSSLEKPRPLKHGLPVLQSGDH